MKNVAILKSDIKQKKAIAYKFLVSIEIEAKIGHQSYIISNENSISKNCKFRTKRVVDGLKM